MLPPPIPVLAGGRQLDAEQRLRRFVEREHKLRTRREERGNSTVEREHKLRTRREERGNSTDQYRQFSEATFSVLLSLVSSHQDDQSQACLGRQLCRLREAIRVEKIKNLWKFPYST